jgi:hypothetical protein
MITYQKGDSLRFVIFLIQNGGCPLFCPLFKFDKPTIIWHTFPKVIEGVKNDPYLFKEAEFSSQTRKNLAKDADPGSPGQSYLRISTEKIRNRHLFS